MTAPFSLLGTLIRLEPLHDEHVDELVAAAAESRETYRLAHVPDGSAAMRDWAAQATRARDEGRQVPFVIREIISDRIVGCTRFYEMDPWQWPVGSSNQRSGAPDGVEIGYTWLARSAQRTGINIDAKLTLMTHAFEAWEVRRVRFRTDERNIRSRRAIEALGASFDGVLRADKAGADDTIRNSAYYSILAPEWPAVKDRLSERLRRRASTAGSVRDDRGPAIRTAVEADLVSVLSLWTEAGAEPTATDDLDGLRRLVAHDGGALLVAELDDVVVGTVIGAWDGWRGSIYRLVVHPDHRRSGLGRRLLGAAEVALEARGCRRSHAIVVDLDTRAMGFWSSTGWHVQDHRLRFVRG
jgi:RimJ/RimL family protein N-acetyltransferase/ribosomal protein S18 acetylase RimI-like enzyme